MTPTPSPALTAHPKRERKEMGQVAKGRLA